MARIFYVVEVHGDYTQANFFKTDKEALAYGIGEFPDFDMYDEPMEDEENEVWISGDKLEFKKGFLFSSENGHWTIDEADDASAKKEVEGFDEGFSAIYFDGFKKGAYGYLGNGIEGKGYKWSADDDGIDESKRSIPTFEEFRTSNTTVAEAKSDGTISDDEDELMDDLMGTIEAAIDDLIANSRDKAYEIGGSFRGPGNVDKIKKLLIAKVKKMKL